MAQKKPKFFTMPADTRLQFTGILRYLMHLTPLDATELLTYISHNAVRNGGIRIDSHYTTDTPQPPRMSIISPKCRPTRTDIRCRTLAELGAGKWGGGNMADMTCEEAIRHIRALQYEGRARERLSEDYGNWLRGYDKHDSVFNADR